VPGLMSITPGWVPGHRRGTRVAPVCVCCKGEAQHHLPCLRPPGGGLRQPGHSEQNKAKLGRETSRTLASNVIWGMLHTPQAVCGMSGRGCHPRLANCHCPGGPCPRAGRAAAAPWGTAVTTHAPGQRCPCCMRPCSTPCPSVKMISAARMHCGRLAGGTTAHPLQRPLLAWSKGTRDGWAPQRASTSAALHHASHSPAHKWSSSSRSSIPQVLLQVSRMGPCVIMPCCTGHTTTRQLLGSGAAVDPDTCAAPVPW